MTGVATERPVPGAVSEKSLVVRLTLLLIRALAPFMGEARAQWAVGRSYAVLYLTRYYLAAQFGKAALGVFWVALSPVLLVAVYLPISLAFEIKLPGSNSHFDYALFYLVGLMAWVALQDAINQGSGSLIYNAGIVRHAPTPPAMLPLVKVLSALTGLCVGMGLLLLLLLFRGVWPGPRLLLLPLTIFLFGLATTGVVLFLSIGVAYVRDLVPMIPTVLAIEFFAVPLCYPLSKLSGKGLLFVRLNPLTPFLNLFRVSLLPFELFSPLDLGLAAFWALLALGLGVLAFRRLAHGLSDVV